MQYNQRKFHISVTDSLILNKSYMSLCLEKQTRYKQMCEDANRNAQQHAKNLCKVLTSSALIMETSKDNKIPLWEKKYELIKSFTPFKQYDFIKSIKFRKNLSLY